MLIACVKLLVWCMGEDWSCHGLDVGTHLAKSGATTRLSHEIGVTWCLSHLFGATSKSCSLSHQFRVTGCMSHQFYATGACRTNIQSFWTLFSHKLKLTNISLTLGDVKTKYKQSRNILSNTSYVIFLQTQFSFRGFAVVGDDSRGQGCVWFDKEGEKLCLAMN